MEYASEGSERAFTELVRRYVDFVFSIAHRTVRDVHLAQDVSQSVFTALARDARRLAQHQVLAGWLLRTTRHISAATVRSKVRRRTREAENFVAPNLIETTDTVWRELEVHLDGALEQLRASDREVLMLRYFSRKTAGEIGGILGVGDEAAQKRVQRALE